jgi:DNA-binding beta-propeller fold protein YncE
MLKSGLLCFLIAMITLCTSIAWAASNEICQFERMWPILEQPWYFLHPQAIAVDDDGYVYIADSDNNRVRKFTADGHFVTEWGKKGTGPGEFNSPTGIASARSGFVYVADSGNDRVQKFSSSGQFIQTWGGSGSQDGLFALIPHQNKKSYYTTWGDLSERNKINYLNL